MNRAIGDTVRFSAQPYYSGIGKVVKIEKNTDAIGGWYVAVEVIEGTGVNRMFQYTSATPMRAGEQLELCRVTDIDADVLVYVYPV